MIHCPLKTHAKGHGKREEEPGKHISLHCQTRKSLAKPLTSQEKQHKTLNKPSLQVKS